MRPDVATIHRWLDPAGFPGIPVEQNQLGTVISVDAERAPELLHALRESDGDFRMLVDLLGTDTGEAIEITYHLRSYSRDEDVFAKCTVTYGGTLCSVWNSYPSALMPERETAELFGLKLDGHPNPKRLFTTDGVEPLLLKSVEIRSLAEVRDR